MSPRRKRRPETTVEAADTSTEPSPAERYAAARRRARAERSELAAFAAGIGFQLDDFQREACEQLEEGRSVLVAAPTGAGKTVVGEFAVHLGLRTGRKTFYTTPIKALSNQKYLDLVAAHGEGKVGLLTGDTTINGEADVVVMTTEVLRNMLYAGSPTLVDLGYVVMDEVHYLADRFRGPVWEEVILHLADDVLLVSLSATVSNAEEFGDWLSMVRGDTAVVVSEHRPVPLWQHVMVRDRVLDLYSARVDPTDPGPNPPINPELLEAVRRAARTGSAPPGRRRDPRGGRGRPPARMGHVRPAPRPVVVERLDEAGLLPAIVFVFSRAGCEAAVEQTLRSRVRLTNAAEARAIAQVVEERCAALPPEDLAVVGYHAWSQALQRGVAAHHAGLLPVFKETVEALFAAGLVKVVYATETLALGINMPARSVVLERLDKWNGTAHAALTPGEYTQLTGRAGRRGIDIEGHAIVLYGEDVDPGGLAGLASRRTYPLRSSFHPTYNMAVNLLGTLAYPQARETLEGSFAQFQADRGVVGLARQARRNEEALAGYATAMTCHLGDFTEYARLRRQITELEKDRSRERSRAAQRAVHASLAAVRRGDVLEYRRGRRTLWALVLDVDADRLDSPVVRVLTPEPRVRTLTSTELPHGATTVATVPVPKHANLRDAGQRRDLAARLRSAVQAAPPAAPVARAGEAGADIGEEIDELRRRLRAHPCHGCSDREEHARWANRWASLDAEHQRLLQRIETRTSSIARDFDKVCALLTELGYLEPDGAGGMVVTDNGRWLARLYAEKDLVLAECLRRGLWAGLDAAQLAAVVSTVVYSARNDALSAPTGAGGGALGDAVRQTVRVSDELAERESQHGVPSSEPVDAGIVSIVHAWAKGAPLDSVLDGTEIGAGDFVRWCKQILDVLDQLATAAPDAEGRRTARRAIELVRRGVVAWSSV
ncbi:ATP-dependent RNA helicase HelY [Georgenia satyanarayanai]|uniref:ATP-dependent RNA helicase HelY n=1 Tax=Georgenia satyanarayanai TaxID=860221 RepID=A0A2Y9A4L6_9MICO|nr:DEAD/DEAH box helicase [Georgenia satyanarayanai]PYG02291.1 ATP-dependent RNA helicase HelY [Georgenia satyanarayanai]SSA37147.1 ATP-dependent RNA helicase HelY [Georgenia satyanarayanai]